MKKILLVDDQPSFINMMGMTLEGRDYEVFHANNGRVGVDKAREVKPDLIVMDIMMPIMDGMSAIAEIQADAELAKTPIIILTARGRELDKETAKELEYVWYMEKPFSPRELVAKIQTILD